MKNTFLLIALIISGFFYASTPKKSKNNLTMVKKTIKISSKTKIKYDRRFNGFIAYDTSCCGTCFAYGTYEETDLGNGLVYWEFTPASQATQSTVITPPCTGEGSYLA